MVEDHVVLLHGDTPTEADARAIESAVERVWGVRGVQSYLHVGLLPSDTRPSEGRAFHQPSEALERLVSATRRGGGGDEAARPALRAVLSTLVDRLPPGERDQFVGHLPADVRALATPPRRRGQASWPRHADEFVRVVVAANALDQATAGDVVASVLGTLRELVPEEATDVAAVLPPELRELWLAAPGQMPTP